MRAGSLWRVALWSLPALLYCGKKGASRNPRESGCSLLAALSTPAVHAAPSPVSFHAAAALPWAKPRRGRPPLQPC